MRRRHSKATPVVDVRIDASNIVIRNKFSKRGGTYYDPQMQNLSGAVKGYLEATAVAMNARVRSPLVAFDRGPYLKIQDVPEFKAKRKADQDPVEVAERKRNVEVFRELCTLSGYRIAETKGYEADDYLAVDLPEGRVQIVSNDSDLWQLWAVNPLVEFVSPEGTRKFSDTWTLPIAIEDYTLWLAIVGTHNGLPGVPRIGPKKCEAMMIADDRSILADFYTQHEETIERQMQAIELPYGDLQLPEPGVCNVQAVEELLLSLEYDPEEALLNFLSRG